MVARKVTLERQLGGGEGQRWLGVCLARAPQPSNDQKKKILLFSYFFIPRAIKASVSLQTQLKGRMQNVHWYITKVHALI